MLESDSTRSSYQEKQSGVALNPALESNFVIGDWSVEPQLNRLSCRTDPYCERRLEPRLMRLLCYLAANPGRVVSRDQLSNELWPRVIVNDNSLTRAVSALRKQLQDVEIGNRQYLVTIPKKGYRLALPVLPCGNSPETQSDPAFPSDTSGWTTGTVRQPFPFWAGGGLYPVVDPGARLVEQCPDGWLHNGRSRSGPGFRPGIERRR